MTLSNPSVRGILGVQFRSFLILAESSTIDVWSEISGRYGYPVGYEPVTIFFLSNPIFFAIINASSLLLTPTVVPTL